MKSTLASAFRTFQRGTRGANMVEYIILVGVVALLAVVGFKAFSTSVSDTVKNQGETVKKADTKGTF